MNNFKNFVIFILSLVILVQSLFLLYFMSQRKPAPVVKKPARQVVVVEKKPAPQIKPVEVVLPPVVVAPKPPFAGKIALVLDDWGYNLRNRDFITDNDFCVTLSVLPFRAYSTHVAQLAYHKNKDVIIHVPMEPQNKDSYGLEENTLLVTMDKKTVLRLLDSAFAVVPYAKGISNHMGSKATEDPRLMTIIMQYLKARDLFFLDSFVTSKTVCQDIARKLRVGFAQRDVFIDNEADEDYIRAQMLKAAQKASRDGKVIAIGHDRPHTIAVLKKMIPELEQRGYRFVSLSEVVEKR